MTLDSSPLSRDGEIGRVDPDATMGGPSPTDHDDMKWGTTCNCSHAS